jgi:hypothetical protein
MKKEKSIYEMNLAQLPVCVPSSRTKRTKLEIRRKPIRLEDGRVFEPRWLLLADCEVGMPTGIAEGILIALVTIGKEQGFRRRVSASFYRLLKTMCLQPTSGRNYRRVKRELVRLARLRIHGNYVLWDAKGEGFLRLEEEFGVFDTLRMISYGRKGEEGKEAGFEITWSEPFWRNFVAGYLMGVDRKLYFDALKRKHKARKLYLLIKQAWHGKESYTFDVSDLGKILVIEEEFLSRIKAVLERLLEQLRERWGKLAGYRFYKRGGFWKLVVYKATSEGEKEESAASLWEKVKGALRLQMTSQAFSSYLLSTSALSLEGDVLIVSVPDPLQKEWLEYRLRKKIEDELSQIAGRRIALRFKSEAKGHPL